MATFRATADNQTLDGTPISDDMASYGFDNVVLNGGDGDDVIRGVRGIGGVFNGGAGNDYVTSFRDIGEEDLPHPHTGGIYNGDEGDDRLSAGSSENSTFNGGDGNDILDKGQSINSRLNGDAGDDVFNLGNVSDSSAESAFVDGGDGNDTANIYHSIDNVTITKQGDTVLVVDPYGASLNITNAETFRFQGDDGISWVEYTFEDLPCFLAGTLIATPSGDVAIETLKAGDLVLTVEGRAKPVRWLARQTVSTRFASPLRVMPVLIRAGALGENLPHRNLFVSPDHAVLVDGQLVHAEALINGSSIVRHTDMPETFVYYHVELDDHSLILAEGVPVETFIDNVTRKAFDNWQDAPEAPVAAELELPRVRSVRQLDPSIANWLAMRARVLGHTEKAA